MTVRAYIENDIKNEKLNLTWIDVKKAWQKENPNQKMGSANQNMALYRAWKDKKWRPNSSSSSQQTDEKIEQKNKLEKSGIADCLKKMTDFNFLGLKKTESGNYYYEIEDKVNGPMYGLFADGKLRRRTFGTYSSRTNIVDFDSIYSKYGTCEAYKKYLQDNKLVDAPPPTPTLVNKEPEASKTVSPSPTPTPTPSTAVVYDLTDKETRRQISKNAKSELKKEKIGKEECKRHIRRFYNSYKTGDKLSDHEEMKDMVKRCNAQHDFTGKGIFNRPSTREMLDALEAINQNWEPKKTDFIILDSRNKIESIIQETLRKKITQINESKKKNLIKEDILKVRLEIHESSINNFSDLTLNKKIRTGFKFLKEISKLKKIGFINENLSGVFQELFGNSLSNIVDNISKPLFNSLLKKLNLPDNLKVEVLDEIMKDKDNLISHMESCEMLSDFVSEKIGFVVGNRINSQQILGTNFIDDTIHELVVSEDFNNLLNLKIQEEVCKIFETYVQNAKNLVTKISQELGSSE